jgi:hypothetical protein
MKDVRGPHVPLTVVAAKKPGAWIVRAWCPFREPKELREVLATIIGTLDQDGIEWTTWKYDLPAYLVYGSGEIDGWGWPVAVVKYPWTRGDSYKGEPEVLRRAERGGLQELWQMAAP